MTMTNEDLVRRIQSGDNVRENMAALWQQNIGFVDKLARKYRGREEYEDLMQQGFIGLYNAAIRYDSGSGALFLTYAAYWIEQSMLRYIDQCGSVVRLPVQRAVSVRKYNSLRQAFITANGWEPSLYEVAQFMNCTPDEAREIIDTAAIQKASSLDSPIESDEGRAGSLGDTVPDKQDHYADTLDQMQNDELAAVLWPMVADLGQQADTFLRARYIDGQTVEDAGKAAGLTRSKARSYHAKWLRELREPGRGYKLMPFADFILSEGMRGTGLSNFNYTWTSSTERTAMQLCERY